jgi:tRNA threonylcarbamoyl adenosine modification protein YjeE
MDTGDQSDLVIDADNEFALQRCACWLADLCRPGDLFFLTGELGVGKTTLARAFIQALGDQETVVPSPSFTLVQPYDTLKGALLHVDLYRISQPDEVYELGLTDHQAGHQKGGQTEPIMLIEWPEHGDHVLRRPDFTVAIAQIGASNRRQLRITAKTPARLEALSASYAREIRLVTFLANAGWSGDTATRLQIAGDASTRRYERLHRDGDKSETAVLMDWRAGPDGPPVVDGQSYSKRAHLAEAAEVYCRVSRYLSNCAVGVPQIYKADEGEGFVLLEDLGTQTLEVMALENDVDLPAFYLEATETLIHLHGACAPDFLSTYDSDVMAIETSLFLDWYLPDLGIEIDDSARLQWTEMWRALARFSDSEPQVCVLRDFHSVNLLWQPHKQGRHRVGVIDVQDALAGPAAYDVVSLLQDARIDVPRPVSDRYLNHYVERRFGADAGSARRFREAFAILGLQRNLKIAGIFVRLALRDNKPQYRAHLPRILNYVQTNLAHEAAAPVRRWLETHAPDWEDRANVQREPN